MSINLSGQVIRSSKNYISFLQNHTIVIHVHNVDLDPIKNAPRDPRYTLTYNYYIIN